MLVIAQLQFTDRVAYDRYQSRFMGVFQKHSGKLIAVDEAPRLIEGQDCPDKAVVMSFPSEEEFNAWADSPEYREISRDREAGALTKTLLVRALG